MSVIPFPPPSGRPHPPPTADAPLEARVEGTFRSPRGRTGRMTGLVRLERFSASDSRLAAVAVVSGELLEPDGTTIGVGSRRVALPASLARESGRTAAVIGPVEVDLMGLTVSLPSFRVALAHQVQAVPAAGPAGLAGGGSR